MRSINRKRLLWFAAALVFMSACSGSAGAKKAVERYLAALQGGDFATLYELNATTQKKVALIYRGEESAREDSLRSSFEEYKVMFVEAGPDSRLWAEKFLFPPDSAFTVTKVVVEEDKEQGTARFKDRMLAIAEIKVDYGSKASAPDSGSGKLKSATYVATFINGYDVVKGLKRKDEIKISEWLFKSIRVKDGEAAYW